MPCGQTADLQTTIIRSNRPPEHHTVITHLIPSEAPPGTAKREVFHCHHFRRLRPQTGFSRPRHDLIEKGYRPIPCKGKIPIGFIGWQHCAATHDIVDVWETSHPDNRNTGILTGEVVAIDVDITRPDLAEAIAAMVRELPGGANAPMRVGKAPKALFLFRTTEPREKIITAWFNIDGTDQRIEVMGTGQQVIVDGIHPTQGSPTYGHQRRSALSLNCRLSIGHRWSASCRMSKLC
ncbi:bifunctional DNA primase/polymerase [Rhizobium rosettiformans]|uniref:bifunctional DNA primase/polymerase n=1 Tax=Rhizobium rosettiformans TaxID=1368430 RepID=UPI003618C8BD